MRLKINNKSFENLFVDDVMKKIMPDLDSMNTEQHNKILNQVQSI